MAVQDIVLEGFGSSGSSSLIVTRGFASGLAEVAAAIPTGGYLPGYRPAERQRHIEVFARGRIEPEDWGRIVAILAGTARGAEPDDLPRAVLELVFGAAPGEEIMEPGAQAAELRAAMRAVEDMDDVPNPASMVRRPSKRELLAALQMLTKIH